MTVDEFDTALTDLETRIDRLRALYENWFRGYEKSEPHVPRKDAERRVYALRKELPRNTALRFRYHQMYLKYTTLATYWQRTARQIEEGTYKPQLQRLKRKLDREQELEQRKERRKLERGGEEKQEGPPGYELDLDESLDVDDLLDELEMEEVAKAIDRPGPHSEPPPTTVRQGLPPANGPATATFARRKDEAGKAQAPAASAEPSQGQNAPRGAPFPNAPFPNAPFPNAAHVPFPNAPFPNAPRTGPMAAPGAASSTTLGRPAPIATPPGQTSPQPARVPPPVVPPAAVRPGAPAAPAQGPARPAPTGPGLSASAQRPFPNTGGAPGAAGSSAAATPPVAPRPAAGAALPGAPVRPAATTIGRPAAQAPAGTSPPRPAPTAAAGTGAQRLAPGANGQGGTFVGRPPVASPLAGPGSAPTEQRLRHIYDEYAAARRRNNEGEVRYEALVSSIQKMLPELNKKHQGKRIDFDVVVKDGRVGLKPKAT
jgi:hypothetical protein